jgi:hypothetical protein
MRDGPPRSADNLVQMLLAPGVLDKVKEDPEAVLPALADRATKNWPVPAFVGDTITYRIVVSSLGLVAVGAVIGAIYLTALAAAGTQHAVPDVLTALGSASIGALAGLLAPSPANRNG